MRTDAEYIRSLERRIRNQRAQLAWWNANFVRKELLHRGSMGWRASDVCALLRRIGSPHLISQDGAVTRRVKVRRADHVSAGK